MTDCESDVLFYPLLAQEELSAATEPPAATESAAGVRTVVGKLLLVVSMGVGIVFMG